MTREKIIFLTEKNPESKKDWSGIPYFMFHALRQVYDVEYVKGPKFDILRKVAYYIERTLQKVIRSKYVFDYGIILSWLYGRAYSAVLRQRKDVKFIFVPAGLTEICALNTTLPIVSVGDCSTLQLLDYYAALSNVAPISRKDIERVERSALSKCARIVFSSQWASDFVRARYNVNCVTIPFGGNILVGNGTIKKLNGRACRLLVVGVDWQRKGGETALAIHRTLQEMNIGSHLTIVGMRPDHPEHVPSNVHFDRIDKDSEGGEQKYIQLLLDSDFLLLPTLADCTPIVIAEAFAAALPVLATRTGGIPSMVQEPTTGFLFEPGDAYGYAKRIAHLIDNPAVYETISAKCLEASRNKFNWQKWAAQIKDLCATL